MKGVRPVDADIDLGLAVLGAMIAEGKIHPPLTNEVIAEACGVSTQRIQQISEKALRKVRVALQFRDKKTFDELLEGMRALSRVNHFVARNGLEN